MASSIRTLLVFLLLSAGTASELRAQVADTSTLPWVPRGRVTALAQTGTTLFIGGVFDRVAPAGVNSGALLWTSPDTGIVAAQMPVFDGVVSAVVADGAGGWFVGGAFSSVDGHARRNLARLTPERQLDLAWTTGTADSISTMAVSAGWLYVGGVVKQVIEEDGTAINRDGAAAIDIASHRATTWDPKLRMFRYFFGGGLPGVWSPGTVNELVVAGDVAYLAGGFREVRGAATGTLVVVDSHNATLLRNFNVNDHEYVLQPPSTQVEVPPRVQTMVLRGNVLYFGGKFESVNSAPRNGLAAVDVGTGQVTPWAPNGTSGPRDTIAALELADDVMYIGGNFRMGGTVGKGLAAADAVTGAPFDWPAFQPTLSQVSTLAVRGSAVYVGGSFSLDGAAPRLSALAVDRATGALLPWNPSPDGAVSVVAAVGDSLLVGGRISAFGAVARNGLVAIDLISGHLLPWTPRAGTVEALLVHQDRLIVAGAGEVSHLGQVRNRLAVFDLATLELTAFDAAVNQAVYAVAAHASTLFASGPFTQAGGASRQFLAALDLDTGMALPWQPPVQQGYYIEAMIVAGGALVVGSSSPWWSGPDPALFSLDLVTGSVSPWPAPNNAVLALASDGPLLYVGGHFSAIAGAPRTGVAAFDIATRTLTPLAVELAFVDVGPTHGRTYTLAVSNSRLYFGGLFISAGGQPRHGLAAVDLATGLVTDWAPVVDRPTTLVATGYGLAAGSDGLDLAHPSVALLNQVGPIGGWVSFFAAPAANGIPGPPIDLRSAIAGTTVSLAWRPPVVGAGLDSYRIEAGSGPGLSNLAVLPVSGLEWSGPAPPGTYYVRVRAIGPGAPGSPSDEIVLVIGAAGCISPPGAPRDLSAIVDAGGDVAVNWVAPAGTDIESYMVDAGTTPGALAPAIPVAGVATTVTVHPPPGVYYARVRALNACGSSPASNEAVIAVGVAAPPLRPGDPRATVAGPRVTLSWTAPAGAEVAYYLVEAGSAPGFANYGHIAVPATVTGWVVDPVPPGVYFVRIYAVSAAGISQPSTEIRVVVG